MNDKKLKKIIFFPLISLVIFIIAIAIIVFRNIDNKERSFSLVQDPQLISRTISANKSLILNKHIEGKFLALHQHLGIIELPLVTVNKNMAERDISNLELKDKIIFRIKEVNSEKWYYSQTYNVSYDNFLSTNSYSFGFPIINNSQGKYYQFEIFSQKGTKNLYLKISSDSSFYKTGYNYSLRGLLKDREFKFFLYYKFKSLIGFSSLALIIILSLLPILLYFVIPKLINYGTLNLVAKKLTFNLNLKYLELAHFGIAGIFLYRIAEYLAIFIFIFYRFRINYDYYSWTSLFYTSDKIQEITIFCLYTIFLLIYFAFVGFYFSFTSNNRKKEISSNKFFIILVFLVAAAFLVNSDLFSFKVMPFWIIVLFSVPIVIQKVVYEKNDKFS